MLDHGGYTIQQKIDMRFLYANNAARSDYSVFTQEVQDPARQAWFIRLQTDDGMTMWYDSLTGTSLYAATSRVEGHLFLSCFVPFIFCACAFVQLRPCGSWCWRKPHPLKETVDASDDESSRLLAVQH